MTRKICSRKLDELGRVVIPMEARIALGIKNKQTFDVYIDNGTIVFKPINDIQACCICGEVNAALTKVNHALVCPDCVEKIKNL